MHQLQVLKSEQDASVNFVSKADEGFYEARYVRRGDYFIAYLSAQSACNRGCGFCHLTTTGQTVGQNATREILLEQADRVLGHYVELRKYHDEPAAPYMHFNFMARGEPLANPNVSDETIGALGHMASRRGLASKTLISTIMPKTLRFSLAQTFLYSRPTIYYSLYSVRDDFRAKWLPGAMPYQQALAQLAEYRERTGGAVKIHFAFIEGENDHADFKTRRIDMVAMTNALVEAKLRDVDINIVRYNPPNDLSKESSEAVIAKNVQILRDGGHKVQIVKRVGFDIKASCGMFVNPGQP